MTAPFAVDLCGYRAKTGAPSTSDAGDPGSIEWGHALFEELGVPRDKPELKNIGTQLEDAALAYLLTIAPQLVMRRSQSIRQFAQYQHLGAYQQFQNEYRGPSQSLSDVEAYLEGLTKSRERTGALRSLRKAIKAADADHQVVLELIAATAEESLLKLDLTIADADATPRLLLAASCKWSLRTDRAQDCITQGNKLAAMRRGSLPHFAVLTMEPRPAMLRLLAYGSGAVDCVYHVALPDLRRAALKLDQRKGTKSAREQRESLERMVAQGRLRDFDALAGEVRRIKP